MGTSRTTERRIESQQRPPEGAPLAPDEQDLLGNQALNERYLSQSQASMNGMNGPSEGSALAAARSEGSGEQEAQPEVTP